MRKGSQVRQVGSRRPVVIGLVIAVVVGGSAAVVPYPNAWRWLVVAGAAMAAALPVVYTLITAQQPQADARRRALNKLQNVGGRRRDQLPLVRAADLQQRVHRAVHSVPYVRRDKEDELEAHLLAGEPVLLVGSSMVGKTRMAATVVQRIFKDRRIAIPDSKDAIGDLQVAGVRLERMVVWLDDVNNLLGIDGLTLGQLESLVEQGNFIVATIRASEYDRFRPSDQLRLPEWEVLDRFRTVFLDRGLSDAEHERLDEAVADFETRARIRRVGIGEFVGAARQVAEALQLADASKDSRIGLAFVRAAGDWYRCGAVSPVPEPLLATLAQPYLDARGRKELSDSAGYQAGLSWAMRDINPTVSLLQRADTDSVSVYDYALDLLTEQAAPIPSATWHVVLQHASMIELLRVGFTANARFDLPDIAVQALGKVASSGNGLAAQVAGYGLGELLSERDDIDGARRAWQQVIDGNSRFATLAATSLARLLERDGDVPEAAAAWRRAIDLGDPNVAPAAAVSLAELLSNNDDVPGAVASLLWAADSGHPDFAPAAAASAGAFLALQDDVPAATAAFRRAISSGHPQFAPAAALSLGMLLADHGDLPGAMDAWQQVISFGQPASAIEAAKYRARHLIGQRDWAAAIAALRQAIDFGDLDEAPWTAVKLGVLLGEQGDIHLARSAVALGVRSGNPLASAAGGLALGSLLAKTGNVPGARAAFERVIDSGQQPAMASAALALGSLLKEDRDIKGARAAYQLAIDSGNLEIAPIAKQRLRDLG
jgi:tetratricopeptide (TPR) repeat protein